MSRGGSEPDQDSVDDHKLRIALVHSSFVVSVFAKPWSVRAGAGVFLQRMVEPIGPYNGKLIGFGRAIRGGRGGILVLSLGFFFFFKSRSVQFYTLKYTINSIHFR